MKRVWLVDDQVPSQKFFGAVKAPVSCEGQLVRLLLEHADLEWEEPIVRDLCVALLDGEFELSCFTSPGAVRQELERVEVPPHLVVFDWAGVGFSPEENVRVIGALLGESPAFVQVYSHEALEAIDPHLKVLREDYPERLLPVAAKADVAPDKLTQKLDDAWQGTLGGPIADEVRLDVRRAVERTLVDLSAIPRAELSALAQRDKEGLLRLIFSKVREEVRTKASTVWEEVVAAQEAKVSGATMRRLLSSAYYFFPLDDLMRRGDLVEIDGEGDCLWMIATPPCDLARFPKKTARRAVMLKVIPVTDENVRKLAGLGAEFDRLGNSIVASQGRSGDLFVPLPNVPAEAGSRKSLRDYLLLSYGWSSRIISVPLNERRPRYMPEVLPGIRRRCCMAEGVVDAVISKVASVITSPGLADLPTGEIERLSAEIVSYGPPRPKKK